MLGLLLGLLPILAFGFCIKLLTKLDDMSVPLDMGLSLGSDSLYSSVSGSLSLSLDERTVLNEHV
jgi:hypothetical protein